MSRFSHSKPSSTSSQVALSSTSGSVCTSVKSALLWLQRLAEACGVGDGVAEIQVRVLLIAVDTDREHEQVGRRPVDDAGACRRRSRPRRTVTGSLQACAFFAIRACYGLTGQSSQVSGMMTARKPYPSDVSDEEWALAVPYLTLLPETAVQRLHLLREAFNGLR